MEGGSEQEQQQAETQQAETQVGGLSPVGDQTDAREAGRLGTTEQCHLVLGTFSEPGWYFHQLPRMGWAPTGGVGVRGRGEAGRRSPTSDRGRPGTVGLRCQP